MYQIVPDIEQSTYTVWMRELDLAYHFSVFADFADLKSQQ